jgi:hypothetical protein
MSYEERMFRNWTIFIGVTVSFVVVIYTAVLLLGPPYRVWSQGMAGEAELRRAEFNRQIAVREAQATSEGAVLLAQAEVERAKGVAEANAIIGNSLQGNDMYIRYLWVQGVNNGTNDVIYIPTEASLPILEARDGARE